MCASHHDELIGRTIRDFKSGNTDAGMQDLKDIFARDSDLRNPANKSSADVAAAHLAQDAEVLHAGTGLMRGELAKLGFPDPLMDKAVADVQCKHIGAALKDAQQLLARDGAKSEPEKKQLMDDHERLHAAGVRDNLLQGLGFPKPDVNAQTAK